MQKKIDKLKKMIGDKVTVKTATGSWTGKLKKVMGLNAECLVEKSDSNCELVQIEKIVL